MRRVRSAAASGQAAAPPSRAMKVRRSIRSPRHADDASVWLSIRHQNRKGCRAKWVAVRQMCTAEVLHNR
jgi:hypothetical protein